jgi:hypothetical protein
MSTLWSRVDPWSITVVALLLIAVIAQSSRLKRWLLGDLYVRLKALEEGLSGETKTRDLEHQTLWSLLNRDPKAAQAILELAAAKLKLAAPPDPTRDP